MLKKRLIFILYYSDGNFFLSRNFRLQRVGDARWLVDKFRFKMIGKFVDEIVVLDVTRDSQRSVLHDQVFRDALSYVMRETFVPLTIGGSLRDMEQVKQRFEFGADKVLFNTSIITKPTLIRECVDRFGAQAVMASLDVYLNEGLYATRILNAELPGLPLMEHIQRVVDLGVGEVLVNSIDRDGTGTGFDLNLAQQCAGVSIPLIIAGGAGKPEHFADILSLPGVDAVATGNLFNFIGKGFEAVRIHLLECSLPVRKAIL